MATGKHQLDARIDIVTPENIAFQYRLAGPFSRLLAYLIDALIRALAIAMLAGALMMTGGMTGLLGLGLGATLLAWFVLEWFYGGLFETYWNGQTPGKRMMNLRVVTVDGRPINALQAVLRNLLRAVDGLPMIDVFALFSGAAPEANIFPSFLVGLVACTMNGRFQRLGDLACGTMVIIEDRHRLLGVSRVNDPQVIAMAAALPAQFVAGRSLARALAMYVERRTYFAPARRAEIAAHLGRVLAEKLQLPPSVSHDLLLCAAYYRTFIADRPESAAGGPGAIGPPPGSPFAAGAPPGPTQPAWPEGARQP